MKDQLAKVERDKDSIKKRLDMLEEQNHGQSLPHSSQQTLLRGSFGLIHLLAIAIVAFLLGRYV